MIFLNNIKELKTGALLLCEGNSSMSKKIQWFNRLTGVKGEAAKLSHIATFLYISPQLALKLGLNFSGCAVMESTTLNKWADKSGFQINPFDDWLINYNGNVRARNITGHNWSSNGIYDFIKDQTGKPYESGIPGFWELLLCGLKLHKFTNDKMLECAESSIMFMQRNGIFDTNQLANNFPPSTFVEGGEMEEYIEDHLLGETIILKV